MLAAGAVLAAAGLAAVQARQLARPLERVAATAARFGDGDFSSSKLPATQIPEIDRITNALRVSGARVDRMLSTERHFTADATHQLRSGLTGISMRFEILARIPIPRSWTRRWPACHRPSSSTRRSTNCSPPPATARPGSATTFDLITVVDDHVAEWSPRFAEARRSLGGHLDGDLARRRHQGTRRSGDRHPDRQRAPSRPWLGHPARRGHVGHRDRPGSRAE